MIGSQIALRKGEKMPTPRFTPWERRKRDLIDAKRTEAGYRSADSFTRKLRECGLKIGQDAYLRRERGETPITADEVWYYAYLLNISPMKALEMYSRLPESEDVFLYARDAIERSDASNGLPLQG